MIVVGLTGGIGAGKSTVSSMLAERGAVIVDADQIARDLQAPGAPLLDVMAARFGEHIINADGSLDRAAVAAIVFNDKDALADLNGIVHPAMQDEIQRQIDVHRGTDRSWSSSTSRCSARTRGWAWRRRSSSTSRSTRRSIVSSTSAA